jgi:hypothetical protein
LRWLFKFTALGFGHTPLAGHVYFDVDCERFGASFRSWGDVKTREPLVIGESKEANAYHKQMHERDVTGGKMATHSCCQSTVSHPFSI